MSVHRSSPRFSAVSSRLVISQIKKTGANGRQSSSARDATDSV